jgi:hypothetical protein
MSSKAIEAISKLAAGIDSNEEFSPGIAVLSEYLPVRKINSVPTNATAFRRERTANVVSVISWPHTEGEDKTAKAREISQKVGEILTEGQDLTPSAKLGYTNYGQCLARSSSGIWLIVFRYGPYCRRQAVTFHFF